MSINFGRENPFLGPKSNLDEILGKVLNHTNKAKTAPTNQDNKLEPGKADSFKMTNNNIDLNSIKSFGIQNGFKPSNN